MLRTLKVIRRSQDSKMCRYFYQIVGYAFLCTFSVLSKYCLKMPMNARMTSIIYYVKSMSMTITYYFSENTYTMHTRHEKCAVLFEQIGNPKTEARR